MTQRSKKPLAETQVNKFREQAKALGCDEDEAAFEERLRKIAKAPVKPKPNLGRPRPKK
jgi:hypothetical protein